MDDVRAAAKARDAWWTVLLVDPIAIRLVRRAAPHTWITPNRLTILAFAVGVGAAAAFAQGGTWWLLLGALAYHVSFVIDCMDGKLARLTGMGSAFGQWLDFILDRVLVTICAIGLMGGQYLRTRDGVYLVLAAVVVFLNLFHQLNGQIMEGALRQASEEIGDVSRAGVAGEPLHAAGGPVRVFLRVRAVLARHRIRADVFSAIEFQMAVFIVGPVFGLIVPVTAVASVLLLAFDIAGVAKFVRTTHGLAAQPPRMPVQRHSSYSTAHSSDGAGNPALPL